MNETRALNAFQYDALKEVGNIGIGQATTSLSRMIKDKKVGISLPDLQLVPLIKLPDYIKNENPVVGIIQGLKGEESGFLLLLLSKESAKMLVKQMFGMEEGGEGFDEMEISALNELGNIMNGTYITALGDFLKLAINLSTPTMVYDMLDSIINQVVGILMPVVDNVLLLKTEFTVDSEKVDGTILVFVNDSSLDSLLASIDRLVGR
ncbi:MAG: chemotaxis protein CheC [Candidatus Methanoperedens sp.]|nr:chemotaxis protein CheC [Candidatus Methanoperedens sp.]